MSGKINNDIAARFREKMNQRVASTRSGRFDMKLSDCEVLSTNEARILVAYSKELGTPRRSQVDEWVTSSFNGRMRLVLETLRSYPDHDVVTAIVHRNQHLRPYKHAEAMIPVGKDRVMDKDNSVWRVVRDDDRIYLARDERDDIEGILRERQTRDRTASLHHRVRLTDLVTAGLNNLEPGDKVRFSNEGILQQGEITSVSGDSATIKANGGSVTVDRLAVVDVYEKSPKSQAEQDRFLVDFFTKAYGDSGFAQKLVSPSSKK